MKRKELYNFVREEIISELSPVEMKANQLTLQLAKQKLADATKKLSTVKDPLEKAQITAVIAADKEELASATAALATKTSTNESELDEMARKAIKFKIGDQEKLELVKDLYQGNWIDQLLDFISEAGEEGISQKELAEKLGKQDSANINPVMQELKMIKVITSTQTNPTPEEIIAVADSPEEDSIEFNLSQDEEDEEDEKDEEEKEEELIDSDEEEDKKAYGGAKKSEKEIGKGNAKILSPEEEEKYTKIRKGIETKISKLFNMSKEKRASSDDMKILKQLISRDDVKKLFKDKGVDIRSIVSDIMK